MSDCKRVGLRGDEKARIWNVCKLVDGRRDEEMHSVYVIADHQLQLVSVFLVRMRVFARVVNPLT